MSRCSSHVLPCPIRVLAFFVSCLVSAALLVPSDAGADEAALSDDWSVFGDLPTLSCVEAMAVDGDGNMLYSRNGDTPMAMASITKVMTAVVALESGIPLDTVCTIPQEVAELDPASSVIGYAPGQTATLEELIWGLLVHSGNDAAVSIACTVAGSEADFVALMNGKAIELGLVSTHFANSHGLDADGHYSTAADLVSLGRYAMGIPLFASIVGSPSTTIDLDGQPTDFASTDALLNSYPGMRGIKTGYTFNAGCAFLGVASRGGQTIYVCVLGCETGEERWQDVSALLDWAFSHYPVERLLDGGAASMGYASFSDRFGWSLLVQVPVEADVRQSPFELDGDVDVSAEIDCGLLVVPGAEIGHISWLRDGDAVEARSVVVGDSLTGSSAFGPFCTPLFS